jgi:heme/copper-type cytochrome/quinol oxidase subunit 2
VDAVPGQTASTWFRADEEGTYEGHSAQFSGTGYPTMRATVEVVSASEYEQFVSEQERDLAQAQDAVQSEIERAAATQTAEQREATPPQNKGESGEAGAPSGGPGQSAGEAGGGE